MNLIAKLWKAIVGIPTNSKQETYCEMVRREKREEEALREQEAEKKKSGSYAY